MNYFIPVFTISTLIWSAALEHSLANGVNNNGSGGRARALNGATVAQPTDGIDAMATNPAGLANLDRSWQLGMIGVYADGRYAKQGEDPVGISDHTGVAPELALVLPFSDALTVGLSVIPEQMRVVEWRYRDAAGGIDGATSYGVRDHSAEFIGIRTALGLGAKVTDRLYFGASAGVLYDRTRLSAPYIFQEQAKLRGIKAALDLETEGVAFNGDLGMIYKATDRLQFGLRYRTKTNIESKGDASGDAGAQFRSLGINGVPGDFHYDAEVETALPRSVTAGLSWKATDRLRVLAQTDWVNWSDSFDELTVKLNNGSNAVINSVAGNADVVDHVPLDWEDRFVYRVGLEFEPVENLWLRLGYSYGKSPIPAENVTPLNAAITEHTLSAGVGFMLGEATIDIGYQYDLPSLVKVGRSKILDQEYSNSSVETEVHWLGVSASVPF
jgi:long-chain fatty acid transport protein